MMRIYKDRLAKWLIKRLLIFAEGRDCKIKVIMIKIEKRRPVKCKKVYGGVIGETEILNGGRGFLITIDSRITERSKIRTFFHEILHIFFNSVSSEAEIEKIEHTLWRILSEEEKQKFGKKMMKKIVKRKDIIKSLDS